MNGHGDGATFSNKHLVYPQSRQPGTCFSTTGYKILDLITLPSGQRLPSKRIITL